ncbi:MULTISPECIES: nucleotidyl transferase AbiEii/AbiGii toxin family protein [unclassified Thioalkalivibrio]|uniref:nucleotidyl transferase AbiEii/AbiGii toxin family protein n=1 Tax=unclassified Thioalkalivibrio TaxID=2621013 RepID=UPI00037A0D5E|nr:MULTISPECIES: nucleotidyl transferase AbiEii/AbiGii toxin family protein [unclassified Thioalkalivibrio]
MDDKRDHHRRIISVLEAMDADLLERTQCLFGGGTSIALRLNDFRMSADIDFLCSSPEGYRELRSMIPRFSETGLSSLFQKPVRQLREARADRYGIRSVLDVDGAPIKFEIVMEGRINLDASFERFHGAPVLSMADSFAEKMLANSDRWGDRSIESRDILDLAAMVHTWGPIPLQSQMKVYAAYGSDPIDDLRKAAQFVLDQDAYRERCFESLQIDSESQAWVTNALRHLGAGKGLEARNASLHGHQNHRSPH